MAESLPSATASLSAEDRAGLVNAFKEKLQSLSGQNPDVLETLSPIVRKHVEVLREIQNELEAKFFEKRASLEAKFQKAYEALYSDIVNGIVEVKSAKSETLVGAKEGEVAEEKGVPDFWLSAMKTNEVLAGEISVCDEGALKFLKDIKWFRIDNPKGFKLEFYFDTNPYFKNDVLTKTYHVVDGDEQILGTAIGTEIEWYPGKSLTRKLLKKKPKKGSKNAKPVTVTANCESFFNFFNPPQVPGDDDDIDEDTAKELQNQKGQDYAIGSIIRDKIISNAVSWFTGEAVQVGDFEDIDDDEDKAKDKDKDDKDKDEDVDDEDEEVSKSKKPSGPKKSERVQLGEGPQGERPPECK